MNRYPTWKYVLIAIIIIIGIIYSFPNIYGSDPALQISSSRGAEISELTELQVQIAFDEAGIKPQSYEINPNNLLIRFADEETQLRAQDAARNALDRTYVVALNLAPSTPDWLRKLGAEPMFLGLDLRGGVHFLMEVDMNAAISKAEERYVSDFRSLFRENKIRYRTISRRDQGGVLVRFQNSAEQENGVRLINKNNPEVKVDSSVSESGEFHALVTLSEQSIIETRTNALQQNIITLRKRVNELGVAEPVIQQQGDRRVVVELPGVQDTARAKDILGATATLEFRMVDDAHSVQDALDGRVPAGSKLYYDRDGQPMLLSKQVLLTGDHIIDAASGIDQASGGPDVTITLDGKGARIFSAATRDEVGKRMAVVFIETKTETVMEDGTAVKKKETIEEVINAATIKEQLGKRFHITGLDSTQEARNLALLLRAGALAAPIEIIEERTVGPSLGQDNIKQGYESVIIGFTLVLIFMVVYYRLFGLIANVALTLNVVLLVALMSMLQATLTMPGIAGIVLTVGMAVDANVLIFERIREEISNGNSPQASIHAGFEKAFSSIADANITTLIAALVLFSFGTGPIKGFAVTLSLGIICSMFTAIMVSRAFINLLYGGRKVQKLMI
ncbi:MAG: protein-export membrane protein SecD [Gammaproteobacteria bacterium RIFCSPLOWO2_02_FULL_47_50]|jgi:preprotein translocase subunit SecD|nr:MAG: protein-export membrane protein SecD [Gammaproteobacteria bacterium RIFCSPLOWO2_01_FULL_47_190]OGT81636.1 MAG: protein-export membrane protein SecD [Gammaproteobacteria bacterium RIFCSPLOWO2_02_FULL_47_50]OGT87492.1 MAG: protein-export membrane protein SecD [Gammaproteobacteria bacterium RIFCSPLOWO2_12_FULL_47_76]